MAARGLEQVEGSERVHLEVVTRLGHRRGDRHLRGEVEDDLRVAVAREGGVERGGVPDVDPLEDEAALLAEPVEVAVRSAAGQVVEHHDVVAALHPPPSRVAADEARSARHQVFQASPVLRCRVRSLVAGCPDARGSAGPDEPGTDAPSSPLSGRGRCQPEASRTAVRASAAADRSSRTAHGRSDVRVREGSRVLARKPRTAPASAPAAPARTRGARLRDRVSHAAPSPPATILKARGKGASRLGVVGSLSPTSSVAASGTSSVRSPRGRACIVETTASGRNDRMPVARPRSEAAARVEAERKRGMAREGWTRWPGPAG